MSIVSFKPSIVMVQITSPVPTYSSIVDPIANGINQIRQDSINSVLDAKTRIANYTGEITDEIRAIRDELHSLDMSKLFTFEIPSIPGLPIPLFPDFSNISIELAEIAQAFQQFQMLDVLKKMLEPMTSFLGMSLDSILPKDPIFGLSPLDILTMSGSDLYNMVYSKMSGMKDAAIALAEAQLSGIQEDIEQAQQAYESAKAVVEGFLATASALVPTPIYPGISALQLEASEIVKSIKTYVLNAGLEIVLGLINSITGILEIDGLSVFPIKIPTMAELKSALMEAALSLVPSDIPYLDDIAALAELAKNGISVSDLISSISLPGLPSISLPSPLLPGLSCFAIEIQRAVSIMFMDYVASIMNKLVEFVQQALGLLGITFPTISIPIPLMSVEINLPDYIP